MNIEDIKILDNHSTLGKLLSKEDMDKVKEFIQEQESELKKEQEQEAFKEGVMYVTSGDFGADVLDNMKQPQQGEKGE